MSTNGGTRNEKNNLLGNQGNKQSGNEIQLVYVILQIKKFYQKILAKIGVQKLVPDPFVFIENQAQPLLENGIFEAS